MRDSLRRGRRSPVDASGKVLARRRLRRRRLVVGGVGTALVLGLAGGGVALAVGGSSGSGYRTATAEPGTVAQTIDTTGTVASASRSDRSFSVAGTVATVDVAVGDTVTAGQVLATLDTASLQDAVDQAEQAVADAQQRLEDDIDSQTASTSTSSSGSSGTGTGSGASSGSTDAAGGTGTAGSTPDDGSTGTGGATTPGDATTPGTTTPGTTNPGTTAPDPAVTDAVA
ncbi:MAG: biotin/lipoyl-binding protein, partial [Pseudonocardia sediminis]